MRHTQIKIFTIYSLLIGFFAFVLPAEARAAGVSLTATPTTQTVTVGQTGTYTIKINRDNYTDKVTLAATGLPSGVTATFTPNTTTATSSTLKLQTLTTTPIGTFNINVKGTANAITIAPIVVQLITRPVPSISVSVTPPSQFIVAGQSTFYDIAVSRFNYDGKITFSAQNLPSGVTALFEPESTYGNSSRMYLYSNGLPFLWQDYGMLVKANNPYDGIDQLVPVQLRVNYGIIWAAQFGAPNLQAANPDFATDVAYDSAGNVYLTGYTYNIATADNDSWVAKFDAAGNQLWLSMISGLNQDKATDVFVDAAGNVYAAGSTQFQGSDIFVAKFAANGTQISFPSLFGTISEEGQNGMQFGAGATGSITLTAVTRVRISNAGERDTQNNPTTGGLFDVTRFTFDANFNRTSTTIVVDGVGEPRDLTVGGDGSIYVLSEDRSQLGGGLFDSYIAVDSQVEKFNASNGQSIYRSLPIGGGDANHANRLKADATGNIFAVGAAFNQSMGIGQPRFFRPWIVKLNTNGTQGWQAGPFGQTEILSLDIDAGGNIVCAGNTWESLRGANPNPGGPGNANARTDAWFGTYSRVNGAQLSLSQFNVEDADSFNAVKVGALSSGFLNSTLYFAGNTLNFKTANLNTHVNALLLRCSSFDCGYTP